MHTPSWLLLPPPASTHAATLDAHLLLNLLLAAALLTLAHLILLVAILRNKKSRKNPRAPFIAPLPLAMSGSTPDPRAPKPRAPFIAPQPGNQSQAMSGSTSEAKADPRPRSTLLLEILPLIAFAALLIFLTLRAERLWAASRYTGPSPAALQVEATGVQFAWYFRYPGPDARFGRTLPTLIDPGAANPLGLDPTDPASPDDLVSSTLVLPANREIDLRLRAQDVIHGFSVPALRLKQNAVPGQITHIHFTPTVPGTYAILCTQLCGLGHYRMTANLRILPPAAYDQWLKSQATP